MGLRIESGELTAAPDPVQPYDPAMSPATVPPAQTAGQLTPADQGGVFDCAADQSGRLSGYQSDISTAMSAGMTAENGRRAGYAADIAPPGAAYGDQPRLPEVPAAATPPASSFLYPWQGDEPTPENA
jgi:hypothetical protein